MTSQTTTEVSSTSALPNTGAPHPAESSSPAPNAAVSNSAKTHTAPPTSPSPHVPAPIPPALHTAGKPAAGATTAGSPEVAAKLSVADISWDVAGKRILKAINQEFPAGSVTGLLGPNGSGKSSLLRIIAQALAPSEGDVNYAGQDLRSLGRKQRAQLVGLVEQDSAADRAISVLDATLLGRIPHRSLLSGPNQQDESIARQMLDQVGMADFADREINSLSGGERQRVHIARALTQQPKILLVDEPTNHLDIAAQLQVLELLETLAANGTTVVTALHDLTLAAAHCDQLVLLSRGEVVAAGVTEQVLTPQTISDVFGVRAEVLINPITGRLLPAFG